MPKVDRFLVFRDEARSKRYVVADTVRLVVLAEFDERREADAFIRARVRDYNAPIVQKHIRRQ